MSNQFDFLHSAIEHNDFYQTLSQLELFYGAYHAENEDDTIKVLTELNDLVAHIICKEKVSLKPLQAIYQFLHLWTEESFEKGYLQTMFVLNLTDNKKFELIASFLMSGLATPELLMGAAIESKNELLLNYLSHLPEFFILQEKQVNLSCMAYSVADLNFIHAYEEKYPFNYVKDLIKNSNDHIETLYLNCLKSQSIEHIEYLKQVHGVNLLSGEKALQMVGACLDTDFKNFSLDKQVEFLNYFNHNLTDKPNEMVMQYLLKLYLSRLIKHTEDYELVSQLFHANIDNQWSNNEALISELKQDTYVQEKLPPFLEHYAIHCEQQKLNTLIEDKKDSKKKMKV